MDTTELLGLFRAEMRDQEQPYLFADETVYAYINAAQVEFCRLTEGIEDGRSVKLSVVPGVEWYPLNKRVLKLRKAYFTATGRPVEVINQERAEQQGVRDEAGAVADGHVHLAEPGAQRLDVGHRRIVEIFPPNEGCELLQDRFAGLDVADRLAQLRNQGLVLLVQIEVHIHVFQGR